MSAILRLANLSRRFGGLLAVNNVSFELAAGEVVGLIGPNGAGKTTLVNLVTGVHRPSAGEVWYGDERIDRLPPDRIARRGIARTFQVVQPFPHMTVLENVTGGALFAGGVATIRAARDKAMEHLEFTGLAGRHRFELLVQNINAHIGDGPADGLAGRRQAGQEQRRAGDQGAPDHRGLGPGDRHLRRGARDAAIEGRRQGGVLT